MATESKVFDCWEALLADIKEIDFPPHPRVPQQKVSVDFGIPQGFSGEAVILPGRKLESPSQIDIRTVGSTSGSDENFKLIVGIVTRVEGLTSSQAMARLKVLTKYVQAQLRSVETGRQIGRNLVALGLPTLRWAITDIVPTVYPMGPQGFAGEAAVDVEFKNRI